MRFVALVTLDRIIQLVGGWPLSVLFVALFLLMGASKITAQQPDREEREAQLRLIGATATVTEASSGLPFNARVDTGATTCSIHCEAMEIEDASENAKDNIGKPIRFLVKNKKGESEWLSAIVADYAIVRTSERADGRYKVKLGIRWQDIEKKVLVTLNDRAHMKYPVLIGRNFLRNDFLVNVAWEGQEALAQMATVTKAVASGKTVLKTNAAPATDALAVNDVAVDAPAEQ